MDEDLLPAPRNSVRPPPGKDRKHGRPGAGQLVLARLVWPRGTVVVPAVLVWDSDEVRCVEWVSRGRRRMTWLPRGDVRWSLEL